MTRPERNADRNRARCCGFGASPGDRQPSTPEHLSQVRVAVLGYAGKRTTRAAQPQRGCISQRAEGVNGIGRVRPQPAGSRNPVGVGRAGLPFPGVAEYGNPGLSAETPSA